MQVALSPYLSMLAVDLGIINSPSKRNFPDYLEIDHIDLPVAINDVNDLLLGVEALRHDFLTPQPVKMLMHNIFA